MARKKNDAIAEVADAISGIMEVMSMPVVVDRPLLHESLATVEMDLLRRLHQLHAKGAKPKQTAGLGVATKD